MGPFPFPGPCVDGIEFFGTPPMSIALRLMNQENPCAFLLLLFLPLV